MAERKLKEPEKKITLKMIDNLMFSCEVCGKAADTIERYLVPKHDFITGRLICPECYRKGKKKMQIVGLMIDLILDKLKADFA